MFLLLSVSNRTAFRGKSRVSVSRSRWTIESGNSFNFSLVFFNRKSLIVWSALFLSSRATKLYGKEMRPKMYHFGCLGTGRVLLVSCTSISFIPYINPTCIIRAKLRLPCKIGQKSDSWLFRPQVPCTSSLHCPIANSVSTQSQQPL